MSPGSSGNMNVHGTVPDTNNVPLTRDTPDVGLQGLAQAVLQHRLCHFTERKYQELKRLLQNHRLMITLFKYASLQICITVTAETTSFGKPRSVNAWPAAFRISCSNTCPELPAPDCISLSLHPQSSSSEKKSDGYDSLAFQSFCLHSSLHDFTPPPLTGSLGRAFLCSAHRLPDPPRRGAVRMASRSFKHQFQNISSLVTGAFVLK